MVLFLFMLTILGPIIGKRVVCQVSCRTFGPLLYIQWNNVLSCISLALVNNNQILFDMWYTTFVGSVYTVDITVHCISLIKWLQKPTLMCNSEL